MHGCQVRSTELIDLGRDIILILGKFEIGNLEYF